MITHEKQTESVVRVLQTVQKSRFWGKIILDIKDGNVLEFQVSQTLKPDKVLLGDEIYETEESKKVS